MLFNNINDIVYYGEGGYSWWFVYNMPIWLRNLSFSHISNARKKQSEANNPDKNDDTIDLLNPDKSKIPNQYKNQPSDYNSKASK